MTHPIHAPVSRLALLAAAALLAAGCASTTSGSVAAGGKGRSHLLLVSSDEVSDLLLDIRLLLVTAATPLVTDDLVVDDIPVPSGV